MGKPDTIPKLFLQRCKERGSKMVALRQKDFGIWQSYTWEDSYKIVKNFSLGLVALGLERGDKVSIVGDNEPEWIWSEYAVQAIGGIVVGLFPDSLPSELRYVIDHSDSKFVIARDQEQTDKVLSIKGELPKVEKVIYWDYKGMAHSDDPILIRFDEVQTLGAEYEQSHPQLFEESIAKGKGCEVARYLYTSGTTGLPKGAMVSHDSLIANCKLLWSSWGRFDEKDEGFSATPLAPMVEVMMSSVGHVSRGVILNFAERPETVTEDAREVSPCAVMYNPRQWEAIASIIQVRIADANFWVRLMYRTLLPIGYKAADLKHPQKPIDYLWGLLYFVANRILFRPLRDRLGLLKTRVANTGGFVLGTDTYRYLRAIGINLLQVYGTTEEGIVATHTPGNVKAESVGVPRPGVEMRISNDGELLVRSRVQSLYSGYYKNPEATGQRMWGNGWQATGDAGHIDDDGHFIFYDRLEDIRHLASGASYSPQYIESGLRFSPYIRDSLAFGDEETDHVGVIINLDFETVGKWAEDHKIAYTSFVDLSQKTEVANLIRKEIQRLNGLLPEASTIRRFAFLHKEFDPDEAELTRTRNVRRRFVEQQYREIIAAIYHGKKEAPISAEVTYMDGRKGVAKTNIIIRSIEEEIRDDRFD